MLLVKHVKNYSYFLSQKGMHVNRVTEFLLGKPLATRHMKEERLTNSEGLATFGTDAVSSTAYATEEILQALVGAGLLFLSVSIPIAMVISFLIFVVAISYRQVIYTYPQGGGVYNVARANLNETFALIGAASLMVDYVLTASVSVAAGIAALTSAVEPLYEHRVILGSIVIIGLTLINLRGVRESGKLFSYPTFAFIGIYAAMFIYGGIRITQGTFPIAPMPPASEFTGILGIALILRAFSSGCTAMTGIEAVSNGVQAFRTPESENAAKTLMRMATILGAIFLGITFFAWYGNIRPSETKTVVSQIARSLFGSGVCYYVVQGITLVILTLAANTPFAGFPRVASQLAKDGYLPRQFMNLGSKGVYHFGIAFLSISSIALLMFFQGTTHALLPLYAVGVFLGFSISQIGMVHHWKHEQGDHTEKIIINTVGFCATALVLVITLWSKFSHGAWLLVPAIGSIVYVMRGIKAHYDDIEKRLRVNGKRQRVYDDKTMVILVSHINEATLHACAVACSHHPKHLQALHVSIEELDVEKIQDQWMQYQQKDLLSKDIAIEIVYSEFRNITGTIISYIKKMQDVWDNDELVIIIPEVIPAKWWQHFLHNQTAAMVRIAIENDPAIDAEILDVPFKVKN